MPRRKANPNVYSQLTPFEIDAILVVRAGVGHVDAVPAQLLTDLAAAPDAASRMLVARHRATDAALLTILASDEDPNVRTAVSVNSSATAKMLSLVLERETSAGVVYKLRNKIARGKLFDAVCAHPQTSVKSLNDLLELAGNDSQAGRYAQERITSVATREQLAARKAAKAAASA